MATIAWTEEAQRWLEDIFEYIAADDPYAAVRTVQGIYERAQLSHSEQVSCASLCEYTGSVLSLARELLSYWKFPLCSCHHRNGVPDHLAVKREAGWQENRLA
jgi:plasmid stabilization system protein ParE